MFNLWYKHGVGKNWFKNREYSLCITLIILFKSLKTPLHKHSNNMIMNFKLQRTEADFSVNLDAFHIARAPCWTVVVWRGLDILLK